jgi:hypothetical protein
MADNLNNAAYAARLAAEDKKKLEAYNKSLKAHKELSNLPPDLAKKQLTKYTPAQQQSLIEQYGNEDPVTKPDQGWLSTAWNYTGGAALSGLKELGKDILGGLSNVSDFSTRLYRTGAVAVTQNVDLSEAWDIANDKGDKVFNPGRIDEAKEKFGQDAVTIAMRIAAGEDQGKILKDATEAQKKYLSFYDKKQGTPEEQALFQDTIDAVQASKYSPGRQIANLLTPAEYEGSGLFYKLVSGSVDAIFRLTADPLLVVGKAKKLYDISKYSLEVIVGSAARDGVAFANYFNQAKTIDFWNEYGSKLKAYREADAAGETAVKAQLIEEMKILAPEFGTAVIQSFNKAAEPIEDALTAKAFFSNAKQVDEMIKGAGGRRRIIAPRMTESRKARVNFLTKTNETFNIDKVGPELTGASFFGEEATDVGIYKLITEGRERIVESMAALNSTRKVGVARFSTADIIVRLDRFKQKFAIAPLFKDDEFDVIATDAPDQIYRLARLVFPQREAKLAAEVFRGIEDVGQRKEFAKGILNNINDIRGINTTEPTQNVGRILAGQGKAIYDTLGNELSAVGAFASDFNTKMTVPSLRDIDRLTARSTIGTKIIGPIANSEFLEKTVSAWSFLTLAGPRYAIRNSIEDLMVNIAIGETPWGLATSRRLTTRVLTTIEAQRGSNAFENMANSPLGAVMRMLNKDEANKYVDEIRRIDQIVVTNKAAIKELNNKIKNLTDETEIKAVRDEIAALRREMDVDVVRKTREIMASALTEGRINRWLKSNGRDPLGKEAVELLTEQIIYGDIENLLGIISEGGFNFATGGDFLTGAVEFTRKHGVRSAALRIIGPKQKYTAAQGKRGFKTLAVSYQDEPSMVAWLLRISYVSNDELGAIAVANLTDEVTAIKKIKEYLNDNPDIVDASILKAKNISVDEHAKIVYDRTRRVFETRITNKNGVKEINEDLLDKVRVLDKDGEYVISGRVSMDDLPIDNNLIPENVIGPELVAVTNTGNYTSSIMDNGWRWLGMSNARMSRQPIVIAEMLTIRKQMRKTGFEDAWIASYVRDVDPNSIDKIAEATELAKRDLARVVEERAIGQTLAYIDNPLIRSQIAFSSRNFARFYRATEDFYRRIGRAVRYNPESIAVAALTYEGITHSGWVQRDDQGEPYFIYPGIEPVYNAYQKMLDTLGLGAEFKVPFPVQFGAQLKMVTPSLNPDAIIPTFAGPVAGVSVKTVEALLNGLGQPGAADTITRFALGKYAVDQPIVSSFLPAHINRLIGAMSKDERDGQYASAHRKAVTYLEAAGHSPKPTIDPVTKELIPPTAKQLEDYRLMVKNTTLSVLGMRFVFGFFAPASPQIQLKSDMSEWVRDNGRANFKQLWNDLKDEYGADYDSAMKRWVELYPNQIPFTISESERTTVPSFGYAEEAGQFVEGNKELFDAYPESAAFLIPNKGGFSWDAYKTMTDMGLRKNLTVDEHLRKIQTAASLQTYYERRDTYETGLKTAGTDYERGVLRKEFTDWSKLFFAGNPLAAQELTQGGQKKIERMNSLNELERLVEDPIAKKASPKTVGALKEMLDVYLEYKNEKDRVDRFGGSQTLITSYKESAIVKLRQLSQFNENTLAAYDSLFGNLLGD